MAGRRLWWGVVRARNGMRVAGGERMAGTTTIPAQLTDRQIQVDVLNALDRDPLRRTSFGVTVSHGVVTLLGCVRSRREAWLAEEAVYETPGVLGIANLLQVEEHPADDAAIAEAAIQALLSTEGITPGSIKVLASAGCLTLCGIVDDLQQRNEAERTVRAVRGVRRVSNALRVARAHLRQAPQPVSALTVH